MQLGRDLTRGDPLPLDKFLLDADVVAIVKNCHDNVLDDNTLFENDDLLRRFFGSERDAEEIRELFDN